MYACALILNLLSIFRTSILYNRSYVLASHECLPVQMDLSTTETEISSVPVGNKFTQIERRCRGSIDDCMNYLSQ